MIAEVSVSSVSGVWTVLSLHYHNGDVIAPPHCQCSGTRSAAHHQIYILHDNCSVQSWIQILCNCSPSPEIVNCHVTIIMSVEMDRMRRFNSRCPACVGMYGNVSVDVGKEECFPGSDVFIMWQLQHVTSGN